MALSSGDKLGPYEILAPIGAGGMGEVYRARDTRLGRDVAIKISHEKFTDRFEREARAIATLNHPNICTLHDVGPDYLVMEYIEGAPLKGPLPLDQALKCAAQILDALDAAHQKGIIHRDLKPENIVVTKTGIKLLDFGLAKFGHSAEPLRDATLTMALTGRNEIVGTLYYMSPEQLQAQATGQEIGARSDIFSFGLVLCEMITGKRAFEGASPASVIGAIMERPAPSIANVAPLSLDRALQRCLAKDPGERWQSARDLKAEIEWIASTPRIEAASKSGRPPLGWIVAAAIATLAALALGVLLWAPWRSAPDPPKVMRFQIAPAERLTVGNAAFSVSPDGSMLVYYANGSDGVERVWLRSMDTLESRPLPGAEVQSTPPMFWSFDSRFVLLNIGGKLKKVDGTGGPPITLSDGLNTLVGVGGSGNRDGVILFGRNPGVVERVFVSGGSPSAVTALNAARKDESHTFPVFLPDGRHFLYLLRTAGSEANGIYLGSIDSRPEQQDPKRLIATDAGADFVPFPGGDRGTILFYRDGTLLAQPFDLRRFETVGEATPLAEQVGINVAFAFFSASAKGTLVYRSTGAGNERLGWLDRQGNRLGQLGEPHRYLELAISPDGTRAAAARSDAWKDIWVTEFAHATETRFTFDPTSDRDPVWSPDRSHLAFSSNRSGQSDLYQHASNGSGEDELLFKSQNAKIVTDWSRDGRYLLYHEYDPKTRTDLWLLPMDAASSGRKPVSFLRSDFHELNGKFSPDGHWIAYQSNESGQYEIYVRPFPKIEGAGKWVVSHGGGRQPHWRGDGKECSTFVPITL
jgi:serine/threonine protein kinase